MDHLITVDVDQMYGIEIEEWPARIAEVAMWLMDHQMNLRFSEAFGQYFVRLPLKKSPHIHQANALATEWTSVLPSAECDYVLGNPPFLGKKEQTSQQKAEVLATWNNAKGCGNLDYVTCWYAKALDYISGTDIAVAFVSTNSITQGEQVGIFWDAMAKRFTPEIRFAHRTFSWESEARGKAHVHVVILGFSCSVRGRRRLFDYEDIRGAPVESQVLRINPYLVDGPNTTIRNRTRPLRNGQRNDRETLANCEIRGGVSQGIQRRSRLSEGAHRVLQILQPRTATSVAETADSLVGLHVKRANVLYLRNGHWWSSKWGPPQPSVPT